MCDAREANEGVIHPSTYAAWGTTKSPTLLRPPRAPAVSLPSLHVSQILSILYSLSLLLLDETPR